MGAVVLAITGAEALYADMGHFGRAPIRRAWFWVVFPALTLNYLGQGALILHQPSTVANPFFLLAPGWAQIPMVVLATAATIIASQAVISGAFSVSMQAVRLGFLPHLTVRHTSEAESGQIYVPAVNWFLLAGVLILMLAFRTSASLATAYGVAVTGTFLLTTVLFLVLAGWVWHWPTWRLVLVGVVFGGVELTFFTANLAKVAHGGWLPLLIGAMVVTVMLTWQRGRRVVTDRRIALEGQLSDFVEHLREHPPQRVPGTAVFPHPTKETVPLALRANVRVQRGRARARGHRVGDLGERAARAAQRAAGRGLADAVARRHRAPGRSLRLSGRAGHPRRAAGRVHADQRTGGRSGHRVLLPVPDHHRARRPARAARWRKRLFIGLAHNAASPAAFFALPVERTIVMGTRVEL